MMCILFLALLAALLALFHLGPELVDHRAGHLAAVDLLDIRRRAEEHKGAKVLAPLQGCQNEVFLVGAADVEVDAVEVLLEQVVLLGLHGEGVVELLQRGRARRHVLVVLRNFCVQRGFGATLLLCGGKR